MIDDNMKPAAKEDGKELKPCPFCGGCAKCELLCTPPFNGFYVECSNEECEVKPITDWQEDAYKAIEIWNRRVNFI